MFKQITSNSFLKSILTLSSGTIIGQIITFLGAPIMTRLFTPEEIGIYTLIITAVSMFGGIMTGRYDIPIVSEEKEKNVYSLLKLSLLFTFFMGIIISVLYTAYYRYTGDSNISYQLMFVSVITLLWLNGLYSITISFNNRRQNYKSISLGSIYQSLSKEISMVILGIFHPAALSLVLSQIIGQVINISRQITNLSKYTKKISKIKFSDMKYVAKKYKKQLFFSSPALFANSFSYSSINIFIEYLFGAATLGYYSISYRVLGIPLNLITTSVSKVYFREASLEYNKNGSYKQTFLRTTFFLIPIAIAMVIALLILSPVLFELLFGKEWRVAGEYVQILAPMYGFRLVVSPLTTGVTISNKQQYELVIQSFFIFASVLLFIVVSFYNLPVSVYLYLISAIFSVIYIIYYIFLFMFSKKA